MYDDQSDHHEPLTICYCPDLSLLDHLLYFALVGTKSTPEPGHVTSRYKVTETISIRHRQSTRVIPALNYNLILVSTTTVTTALDTPLSLLPSTSTSTSTVQYLYWHSIGLVRLRGI
jgi:hypothetical protein